MKYVIPMYESERGWVGKIDGYAGPFDDREAAATFQKAYNLKYNNEKVVSDYYIAAQDPVPTPTRSAITGARCERHQRKPLPSRQCAWRWNSCSRWSAKDWCCCNRALFGEFKIKEHQ